MRRLTINMTKEQYQSLKDLAALHGKSIEQYALERLFTVQAGEDQALQEFGAVLTQRATDGWVGAVSGDGFDAIVDEELSRDQPRSAGKRQIKRGSLAALTDGLPIQEEGAAQTIRAMRDSDHY